MKEGLALHAVPAPSVRARGQCIAWTALTLVWLGSLGWRALISPDEGRYASIALEMLQSGDWLTPRLNGLLYFEKPPLQYWISAAFFQLFGVNEFAARLWPGLAGLFTIVTTSLGARLVWGEEAGHHAAIVTAGMAWVVANSHFLSLDMGLTFFLTLALCAFLVSQKNPASPSIRRNGMWLCWAAMAGATLSKGLVGLLIPGATLVLYSLGTRRFGFWRDMHWRSGAAIFLALAAPWFIAMSLANPGFFEFFFIGEHFRRFLTDEAHRTGPIHYFVPLLIAGSLPWTTLVLAKVDPREPGSAAEPFQYRRLLWIWIAFVFVFFSVSRSKLPSYILPIFPAMALLIANGLTHVSAHRLKRHLILPALAWLAFGIAASSARRFASADTPLETLRPLAYAISLAAAVFLLCAAAAWHLLGRARRLAAVIAVSAGSVLAVTIAMLGHDSYGRSLKSSASLASSMAPYLGPGTEVFSVRYYDQTLPFYLRRPVTLVDYRDEFRFGEDAEPWRWVPTLEAFEARWRALPRATAIMRPDTFRALRDNRLPMKLAYQDAVRVVVIRQEGGSP